MIGQVAQLEGEGQSREGQHVEAPQERPRIQLDADGLCTQPFPLYSEVGASPQGLQPV